MAVSARAACLKIHVTVIFSLKGEKEEEMSKRIQNAEPPFPVIMLSLRSERTLQTQHLGLGLTGRVEDSQTQTLEPGAVHGSPDSVGKDLLCMFLLFPSHSGPSCDKETSKPWKHRMFPKINAFFNRDV